MMSNTSRYGAGRPLSGRIVNRAVTRGYFSRSTRSMTSSSSWTVVSVLGVGATGVGADGGIARSPLRWAATGPASTSKSSAASASGSSRWYLHIDVCNPLQRVEASQHPERAQHQHDPRDPRQEQLHDV